MTPELGHPDADVLMELAYGELETAQAQQIQHHVDGCATCDGVLQSIGGVRRAMAPLADVEAPASGLDSLLAYAAQTAAGNAAASRARPVWWRRWGFAGLTAFASALCLVALTSVFSLDRPSTEALSGDTPVADARGAAHPSGGGVDWLGGGARPVQSPEFDGVTGDEGAPGQRSMGEGAAAAPSAAPTSGAPLEDAKVALRKAEKGGGASSRADRAPTADAVAVGGASAREARDRKEPPAARNLALAPPPPKPRAPAAPVPGGRSQGDASPQARDGAGAFSTGAPEAEAREDASPPAAATERMVAEASAAPKAARAGVQEMAEAAAKKRAQEELSPAGDSAPSASAAAEATAGARILALGQEATALRQALARGASGDARGELLSRLCRVEDALGEAARADVTCGLLLRDFPGASGADFARRRQQERAAE